MGVLLKAGETRFLKFKIENLPKLDIIQNIIFTIKGKVTMTKSYPSEVEYADGVFLIPFTQEDTMSMVGIYEAEAQINLNNRSVIKSDIGKGYISDTLATQIIGGSSPSEDIDDVVINLVVDGEVVYAGGGSSSNISMNVVQKYNGVDISVTDNGVKYTAFVKDGENGKDGTNGMNGKDGVDGHTPIKGVDYWTEEDKASIVADVIDALPTAESGVY